MADMKNGELNNIPQAVKSELENKKYVSPKENLLKAMEVNPLLLKLIQKLGIENPNIDIVKTTLSNLKKRLKDKGKSWEDMNDMDIKWALITGKSYGKMWEGQSDYNFKKTLLPLELKYMYKLIEIIEKFGLKYNNFHDFKKDYYEVGHDSGYIERILRLIQLKGGILPEGGMLYYLFEIDEDWLQKVGNLQNLYYDDLCFMNKLSLFEGKPFAPKTELEKSEVENIDKFKLIVMIDMAEKDCKTFEKFMKYKDLELVNINYDNLTLLKGKPFAPKTKIGRFYVYKNSYAVLKAMVKEAESRDCKSFEEFMDLGDDTEAIINRISAKK